MATTELKGASMAPTDAEVEELLRLLHAVDAFPRGGLYQGYYAVAAAMRYEKQWLKVVADANRKASQDETVPPLDVAFAWFVHRQDPGGYQRCEVVEPRLRKSAFGFGVSSRAEWEAVVGKGTHWPPPGPTSAGSATAGIPTGKRPSFALDVAAAMPRLSWQLHTWLRPHFLDEDFLRRARVRYGRLLALHADHPGALLVPAADIALLWHTHLGLSGHYASTCRKLLGPGAEPWRPDYLALGQPGGPQFDEALAETGRLYQAKYDEPYVTPCTAWVPTSVPYPLAAPTSPVAFMLRAFDDNPQQLQHKAAIDQLAGALPGLAFPQPGTQGVPRSGAHALYAAWLAAWRADRMFNDQTCGGCCCISSHSLRLSTLEHTNASLVSLAYFMELPAWDKHPYLQAIVVRKGLWNQTAIAGSPGFALSDPARYLQPGRGPLHRMAGLSALLSGSPANPPNLEESSPLWVLLSQPKYRDAMLCQFGTMWGQAASTWGVSGMRRRHLKRRNSRDLGNYAGATDYYVPVYYGFDAVHYGHDRDGDLDGDGDGGGGGDSGGGGGDGGGGGGWGDSGGGGGDGGGGCGGGGD